jgi:hypothetical protein
MSKTKKIEAPAAQAVAVTPKASSVKPPKTPKEPKPPVVKKVTAKVAGKAPSKAAPKLPPKAKPPAVTAPAPVVDGGKVKLKLVRDSFTMPQADFDVVQILKDRALAFKRPAKKSELLRAGLHALSALTDARLKAALESLEPLKAGRPKKDA